MRHIDVEFSLVAPDVELKAKQLFWLPLTEPTAVK
jgi:hypothetical protein